MGAPEQPLTGLPVKGSGRLHDAAHHCGDRSWLRRTAHPEYPHLPGLAQLPVARAHRVLGDVVQHGDPDSDPRRESAARAAAVVVGEHDHFPARLVLGFPDFAVAPAAFVAGLCRGRLQQYRVSARKCEVACCRRAQLPPVCHRRGPIARARWNAAGSVTEPNAAVPVLPEPGLHRGHWLKNDPSKRWEQFRHSRMCGFA